MRRPRLQPAAELAQEMLAGALGGAIIAAAVAGKRPLFWGGLGAALGLGLGIWAYFDRRRRPGP